MNQNNRDNERKTGTDPLRRNTVEGVASKSGLSPFSFDPSLRELFDAACNDTLTDEQFDRLEAALAAGEDARREYLRYFTLNGEMRYLVSVGQADQAARERTGEWDSAEACFAESPPVELLDNTFGVPSPVGFFQGMAENFAPDWARAYLLSAAVLGLFLLAASIIQVSRHTIISQPKQLAGITPGETELNFVARVTAAADCKWDNPNEGTFAGAWVAVGRKYALASGLMEITYTSGARVILEGPCEYAVDSDAGGYLKVGKLTARMETKAEGGRRKAENSSDSNLLATSHQPLATGSSSLIPRPSSFTVTTPTAVITDLGTEFGVEVDKNGDTTSHVFRGLVRVHILPSPASGGHHGVVGAGGEGGIVQLAAGESVLVKKDEAEAVRFTHPTKAPRFVRQISRTKIESIDLVDIVAGGDGFSGRRDAGIDPTNGRVVAETAKYNPALSREENLRSSDRKYHRVDALPFVDGVFIPHDGLSVQVDSAGRTFSDFGVAESATWQYIWAGDKPTKPPYPARIAGVDYAEPPHGFLLFHANAAITFDLESIRRANPGRKLSRFVAVAANVGKTDDSVERPMTADIWAIVDGQVRRHQRQEYSAWKWGHNGVLQISIPIDEANRFLTLAATDAGDGISGDWIIFGDPRLEFKPQKQNESKEDSQ